MIGTEIGFYYYLSGDDLDFALGLRPLADAKKDLGVYPTRQKKRPNRRKDQACTRHDYPAWPSRRLARSSSRN